MDHSPPHKYTKHDMQEGSRDPKNVCGVSKGDSVGEAIVLYACELSVVLYIYHNN